MKKENWQTLFTIGTFIVVLIVLFQTCNRKEYAPVYNLPDSIDKAIDKKLDSLLKMEWTIENNTTNIKKEYYFETKNFLNLPDSVKRSRVMELSRKLLEE